MLVREVGPTLRSRSLRCSPTTGSGRPLEVRDAPTAIGRLSYAVRWHGDRPALLWELDPHPDVGAFELTAPGLDRSWRTTDPSGEALLGPVEARVS